MNTIPVDRMSSCSLFAALCLLWAGMIIGVSFIATPAKFLAPSLTLPVGLDVGRHTFAVFAKVEWVMAITCAVLALLGDIRWKALTVVTLVAILLGVQARALIPELDRRVAAYMAGQIPPASILHRVYIGTELLKLVVLVGGATALAAGSRFRPTRRDQS